MSGLTEPIKRKAAFHVERDAAKNDSDLTKICALGKQLETTRREKLFLHTMNEIGSGAFAFTAALMVSSTLLERLCVSMYSWMDIVVDVLCVKK